MAMPTSLVGTPIDSVSKFKIKNYEAIQEHLTVTSIDTNNKGDG